MSANVLNRKTTIKHLCYERLIKICPIKKGQTRWLNLVSRALHISPYGFTKHMSVGKYRLRLDPGDENDLYYYFGFAGAAYSRLVVRLLQPGDCVIDIGANVGHFSAVCAGMVGTTGQVNAVEASPVLFKRLQELVAEVPDGPIKAHHAAVWSIEGPLSFYLADNSGWSSLKKNDTFHPYECVMVQGVTIDAFINRNDISHVRLLKIDIEGAEMDALLGSKESMRAGKIDLIFLEAEPCRLNSYRHSGEEIAALMEDNSFRAVACIKEDDIQPVLENNQIPGKFNGDYLYAHKTQAEEVKNKIFGK